MFLKTLKAIRAHFHALIIFHLALFGKQSLIDAIWTQQQTPLPAQGKERLIFFLQRRLDLLDHLGVLRVGELRLAGVHGKHTAPFKAVPVFRHEMDVQVAARVAIRAVVELIRMKGGVNRLCRARNSRNSGLSWENLLSFFADLIIHAAVHISNGKVNQKEGSLSEVLFV